MSVKIKPQEIYLLERFVSVEYFATLLDTWQEMVRHVESRLASFMQNLPADYRSWPVPEQPDIVWGQTVLPNFRDTLQGLQTGFVLLKHNDPKGLEYAQGPRSDYKGQLDYSTAWMKADGEDRYRSLLGKAVEMAHNVAMTEGAYWRYLPLSKYSLESASVDRPAHWPNYQINKHVSVRTGDKTSVSGIYVPDVEDGCAQYLCGSRQEAPSASVLVGYRDLLHPATKEKYGEEPIFEVRTCVWYLVERIADAGVPVQAAPLSAGPLHRVPAGDECPEAGFYFSPARAESRRHFQKGEVMPAFDSDYGATIWQWDSNQR